MKAGRTIETVGPPDGYQENGYLNVTLHDPARRGAVEAGLRERGIGFGNVYPGSMSTQPAAAEYLAGKLDGAEAEKLSASVLNLPLFAYITDGEIEEVLAALAFQL